MIHSSGNRHTFQIKVCLFSIKSLNQDDSLKIYSMSDPPVLDLIRIGMHFRPKEVWKWPTSWNPLVTLHTTPPRCCYLIVCWKRLLEA